MSREVEFTPSAGDNTSALNAAIASTATGGQILVIQPGICQISGQWQIPSGAKIRGYSQASTILQKTNNAPPDQNMLVNASAQPISDISISDLTIDGNSQNQIAPYYPIGFSSVSRINIDRLKFTNPWGTALWINGSDSPLPPVDGAQINSDVNVRDCIFDGTGQKDSSGDLAVLGRINRVLFENNRMTGAGANQLALQFLYNFNIIGNYLSNFWRGIYVETSHFGSITRNILDTLSTPSPVIGDARAVGIWLTTATESYLGQNFNGCHWIDVTHNFVSNLVRSTGSTGLAGIVVSGPPSSTTVNTHAISIQVNDNTIAGGFTQDNQGVGIVIEGQHDSTLVSRNTIWGFNIGIIPTGTYDGVSISSSASVRDNTAENCNICGVSASGTQHLNFSMIGNRMLGNASAGGWSGPTPSGYLSVNNQGF